MLFEFSNYLSKNLSIMVLNLYWQIPSVMELNVFLIV